MKMTKYLTLVTDNDRSAFSACLDRVFTAQETAPGCVEVKAGDWNVEQATLFHAADMLRDYITDLLDDAGTNEPDPKGLIIRQLVSAALDQIDWNEFAQHYIDKIAQNA